jgi:hypothetical protein
MVIDLKMFLWAIYCVINNFVDICVYSHLVPEYWTFEFWRQHAHLHLVYDISEYRCLKRRIIGKRKVSRWETQSDDTFIINH